MKINYYLSLVFLLAQSYSAASKLNEGHAIAQAVSRWLPIMVAQVCIQAACGVCGGQSGIGAGFLQVLRFPLPIIPPISPSS
jgi:Mn2+/Fe2+ NRAMP family transporter